MLGSRDVGAGICSNSHEGFGHGAAQTGSAVTSQQMLRCNLRSLHAMGIAEIPLPVYARSNSPMAA